MQIRLASWNINGIRSAIKKNFWSITSSLNLDILSLQEIKAGDSVMNNLESLLEYQPFILLHHSAVNRKGYSGVATFSLTGNSLESSKVEVEYIFEKNTNTTLTKQTNISLVSFQIGLGIEKFDVEGRIVIAEYHTTTGNTFTLINAYYPQGGRGQFRIDYKIEFYEAVLQKALELKSLGHNIILCGDFNTTVSDIDLARPKQNRKTTGCLPEERESLNSFFRAGFVDSFRYFNPNQKDVYTYWDQITRARDRNVGWRIDYFLVDKDLLTNLVEASVHSDIFGSDHCPVSITLEF